MKNTWVIVADAARARFFRVEDNAGAYAGSQAAPGEASVPRGMLVEFSELVNLAARAPETSLASDQPGQGHDRFGQATHGMTEPTTPKEAETQRFAKDVVEALTRALHGGEMARFYLVAAPRFLGLLRDKIGNNGLKKALVDDLAKDLSLRRPDEIRRALPERL